MEQQNNLLIDQLDAQQQGNSIPEAAALLANDEAARAEMQYLELAVAGVQLEGLREQVAAVGKQFKVAETPVVTMKQPARRSIVRNVFQVAAAVILLIGGAVVYKFVATTSTGFYTEYYQQYELSTSRSGEAANNIETAYLNKDWQGVINAFESTPEKTNKEYFLAGMAAMETRNYEFSIQQFTAVLDRNRQNNDDYYNDEAEYYQALAYLANNQVNEGVREIELIRANKAHLFQAKAANMSTIELKILKQKSN